MTNLLFITHYTGRGGGESVQLNLMSELASRGYMMHLVTPSRGTFNVLAEPLGVQSHILPFRGVSTYFIPFLYKRFPVVSALTTLLRTLQVDLIHSDYHALPFAVGAGQRAGVPVLWNAMGGWFSLRPWQAGFFRRQVTRKIAITDTVRRELLANRAAFPPEDMQIIIPGVNPETLAPDLVSGDGVRKHIGIGPETPLVSLIGRFQHIKGQHIFLDMARRIATELPEVRFALSGDNVFNVAADEVYKQSIIDGVRNDPVLQDRVSFLGFWPDSREVLAASDVIVCSSYSESLGMVVIEGMAMGRAVVSTRAGGPSETVIDGETGFLVDAGNAEAFAVRVLQLLRDTALRQRIGEAARQHVIMSLSVRAYADQFERIIRELVPSRA